MTNQNEAPFPEELADLVSMLTYRDDWTFTLSHLDRGQGSKGLTLVIKIKCQDSYDHSKTKYVLHYMIVPAASYNRQSWQRWLLNQILLVEQHEACEFFTIGGNKPYAPNHGPGFDPYIIFDLTTAEDRSIDFRGNRSE